MAIQQVICDFGRLHYYYLLFKQGDYTAKKSKVDYNQWQGEFHGAEPGAEWVAEPGAEPVAGQVAEPVVEQVAGQAAEQQDAQTKDDIPGKQGG